MGKVGGTLARLIKQRGEGEIALVGVGSRTFMHADALARQIGARAVEHAAECIAMADLTLLTVPDDAIHEVADAAARQIDSAAGKLVAHTSGARDAADLEPLALRGAAVGSVHPAFPFADVEDASAGIAGAAWAVEAEEAALRDALLQLIAVCRGQAWILPPKGKTLYHAALTIASNYTVTLYAIAEKMLAALAGDRDLAAVVLNPLMAGTVHNLAQQGVPDALTGALVRGDVGTIKAHIEVLQAFDPALAELYRALGRLTLPLAAARGANTDDLAQALG